MSEIWPTMRKVNVCPGEIDIAIKQMYINKTTKIEVGKLMTVTK